MHHYDIVGWVYDGAIFCENDKPNASDEDVSPVFAGDDGWQEDACDACHWPLDDNREVHGVWYSEPRVTLCRSCWLAVPEPLGSDVWPVMDGWSGLDWCDGCERKFMPRPICETCEQRHSDYPHEPGYLPGCDACEDHCHCGPGVAEGRETQCVWTEHEDEDEGEES